MQSKMFLQGDFVRYTNNKQFENDDGSLLSLNGKVGEVVGRINNTDGIVVDFGGNAFVVSPEHIEVQSWKGEDGNIRALERKWKTSDEKKRGKGKKGDAQ